MRIKKRVIIAQIFTAAEDYRYDGVYDVSAITRHTSADILRFPERSPRLRRQFPAGYAVSPSLCSLLGIIKNSAITLILLMSIGCC
ncbi:hypothetical protein AXX16_1287 [Serratia rubidaea]|uniref:hypothetical protein n=1 Tax=Serratia rubidaea TaxID=61652 RepID=UPI00078AF803|nr:hypothetical protein [Serratia rubidaea]AML57007.1 hypothetical protein AXX16_1287 [Serratia rubidaea]